VDHAPLRPVPLSPAGPVDPDRAASHVSALLPGVPAPHARAFALVLLAGRNRAQAAAETGLSDAEIGRALATARTAVRRSVRPLEGSGWCRRAEALVSDRLDGVLSGADATRLDVHLRNCPRCVEHERRLIQGQNGVIAAFGRDPTEGPPAELTLVPDAPADEPVPRPQLTSLVAVSSGVLIVLSSLLVIAAIVFALVALLGL
jgi:hypothetical protein